MSFFQGETSQFLRAEGYLSGFCEGYLAALGSSRTEDVAEAFIRSRSEVILWILERRAISVPESVRRRISECRDLDRLEPWFRHAVRLPLDTRSIDEDFLDWTSLDEHSDAGG